MATRTEIPVKVQSRDNRSLPETTAILNKVEWIRSERLKNAIKTFGLLFLFAFLSIFVPILHFFLVPALFISSFVFGIEKWQETVRNGGGEGECPKCHGVFRVQSSRWKERITNHCDHCHEDLEIRI